MRKKVVVLWGVMFATILFLGWSVYVDAQQQKTEQIKQLLKEAYPPLLGQD